MVIQASLPLSRQLSFNGQPARTHRRDFPKPFLKWAGGKTKLLPELEKCVPSTFSRYVEPFLGGGALFFFLQPPEAVLSDLNGALIDSYRAVRDHLDDLIEELQLYPNNEAFYYRIRQEDPKGLPLVKRAAREIYLNKTCFNGLYRVNKSGQFNVPFGRRPNPLICDEPTLRAASAALQGATLLHGHYAHVLREYVRPDDFVFLDPPYYPVGAYADFNRFTSECFYEEDHVELRNEFTRLVELGCHSILTNSNAEFVRRLYDRFEYRVIDAPRTISSNPKTRSGEDLIVFGARRRRKTSPAPRGSAADIIPNFPGTRFMGSKFRVLPLIQDVLADITFDSALDAFSGSGCVSYMLKGMGKTVTSNDFMSFCYHFARATVENPGVRLTDEDLVLLLSDNPRAGTFIQDVFRGLYFTDDENYFLDCVRANVELLDDPLKRSLAIAALCRACLKRRPRGVFTYVGARYEDGRRDLKMALREHFLLNVETFNRSVFDNGCPNRSLNLDIFEVDESPDLVYLDPPYYTPHSDNEYTRRYHFVEGLARRWEGLEIQTHTKTKKFKRYHTPFADAAGATRAFHQLIEKFKDSILVVSNSSNGLPTKGDLIAMLKNTKRSVSVHQIDHTYSFGTHSHLPGNDTSRVTEYLFVAS